MFICQFVKPYNIDDYNNNYNIDDQLKTGLKHCALKKYV